MKFLNLKRKNVKLKYKTLCNFSVKPYKYISLCYNMTDIIKVNNIIDNELIDIIQNDFKNINKFFKSWTFR